MSHFVVICRVLEFLSLLVGARRHFGAGLIKQECELIAQAVIRGGGIGFPGVTGKARREGGEVGGSFTGLTLPEAGRVGSEIRRHKNQGRGWKVEDGGWTNGRRKI